MNGRSFASIVFSLIVVGVLVAVGVGIYQAGIAQGVIDAGRFPAGATVPVAGYGYHDGGFGFLGLLFPLFFLFLIFGLIRAAFGHRRGWGHGYGYGSGDMSGRRWDREQYVAEMHRRLHETDAGSSGNAAGSTGSGASGSGSGSAPANPGSSGPR
ncbi:MAG TPA: hypothetical protein VGM49_02340 [Candidatus Limnocylindrales bacterium]